MTKRAYAKYGNDRFLSVELKPSDFMYRRQAQDHLKQLCFAGFDLLGRTWELVLPRLRSGEMLELLMFATRGPGLDPISAGEVRDWHIPTACPQNAELKVAKYVPP